jgi:hemoglobin
MNDAMQDPAPRSTPYEMLGGEHAVRALVDRFYDLMELEPQYALIRRLHAPDLSHARDKLYWFLSGWLGGPGLYVERFGHPMLRARHLRFPIGRAERDAWMACFDQAMRESGVAPDLREALAQALFRTADWMRNRPGDGPGDGPA